MLALGAGFAKDRGAGMARQSKGARSVATRSLMAASATAVVAAPHLANVAAVGAEEAPTPSREVAATDTVIVSDRRALSSAEIAAKDITSTPAGRTKLADIVAAERLMTEARTYRIYQFGAETISASASTKLSVMEGKNAAGETVYEVTPFATAGPQAGSGGFLVPPDDQFYIAGYNSFGSDIGTWERDINWQIDHANNWKGKNESAAHDYFRITGNMMASCIDCGSSQGWKREWLEFNASDNFSSWWSEFEFPQPSNSHAYGSGTSSVGFGKNWSVNIGVPPVSGGVGGSWGTTMSKSTENIHPVARTEDGSHGEQWCYYSSSEFTGSRTVTTRANIMTGTAGLLGYGWAVYYGMSDSYSGCPSQL